MIQRRSNPGTESRATSTTPIADTQSTATGWFTFASQQVSWWSVHEFATPRLQQAGDWPLIGTPAWCQLGDRDPAKWAAILDGAQHWALRLETCQEAVQVAAEDLSAAADWSAIAHRIRCRAEFYAARPWLRRG